MGVNTIHEKKTIKKNNKKKNKQKKQTKIETKLTVDKKTNKLSCDNISSNLTVQKIGKKNFNSEYDSDSDSGESFQVNLPFPNLFLTMSSSSSSEDSTESDGGTINVEKKVPITFLSSESVKYKIDRNKIKFSITLT